MLKVLLTFEKYGQKVSFYHFKDKFFFKKLLKIANRIWYRLLQ